MDIVAEIAASASRRSVVIPAWNRSVVLGVDELGSHLLKHRLPLFILQPLLSDEPLDQLNSLIMA